MEDAGHVLCGRKSSKDTPGECAEDLGASLLSTLFTVGELEAALFACFPADTAEDWDLCGLSVGDSEKPVHRIALALDADFGAVCAAAEAGCDVLLTHHPVYLVPPERIGPPAPRTSDASAAVFEAVRCGVALLAYHTCLDRAIDAQKVLPARLSLEYLHPLEGWAGLIATTRASGGDGAVSVHPDPASPAYGAVCSAGVGSMTLGDLATRCTTDLGGRAPRVWGDPARLVRSVATCTGSAGSLADDALAGRVDVLIAGEVRYHAAVDVAGRGLALIELGHDVSELPLLDCMRRALLACGCPMDCIVTLERPAHWHL
jgi:putative NIF3 family GTP cyclohydrolase 1 type 2